MTERKGSAATVVDIEPVKTVTCAFYILGKRPIILSRLSIKARQELLAPRGRKTSAQKQASLKHDPFQEFHDAPYILADPNAPTYLGVMSSGFKGAMATASLDLPGARKAQIGRLVWVEDDLTPLYGIPKLSMTPVRQSDIAHTPDIRTRVLVEEWACIVRVTFVETLIKTRAIANLLAAAGLTAGIGDWRPEKGKGTHGQFLVVNETNPLFRDILAKGGRAAQMAAMNDPVCADAESEELLMWWLAETKRRGFVLTPDSLDADVAVVADGDDDADL